MTAKPKPSLKKPDTSSQALISALKSENLKLQKQVAKLQAKNISNNNRVKALEKELHHARPHLEIDLNAAIEEARALTNKALQKLKPE